jgi:phosphoheptose isomerase
MQDVDITAELLGQFDGRRDSLNACPLTNVSALGATAEV